MQIYLSLMSWNLSWYKSLKLDQSLATDLLLPRGAFQSKKVEASIVANRSVFKLFLTNNWKIQPVLHWIKSNHIDKYRSKNISNNLQNENDDAIATKNCRGLIVIRNAMRIVTEEETLYTNWTGCIFGLWLTLELSPAVSTSYWALSVDGEARPLIRFNYILTVQQKYWSSRTLALFTRPFGQFLACNCVQNTD